MLAEVRATGKTLQELVAGMPQYPQTMINVRVSGKPDLEAAPVQAAVAEVEAQLGDRGRVVLRASGTEPVIRVMVEGEDKAEVKTLAGQIADVVAGDPA